MWRCATQWIRGSMHINSITGQIIDSAMKVHSALGPGLLESAYEACLAFELRDRGLAVVRQAECPVVYRDVKMDVAYRLDLLVAERVIVELKSVEKMIPLYDAQLLSYLKLADLSVGLLMNFNVPKMKEGIKRIVNRLTE